MIKCEKCGHENNDGSIRCINCLEELKQHKKTDYRNQDIKELPKMTKKDLIDALVVGGIVITTIAVAICLVILVENVLL